MTSLAKMLITCAGALATFARDTVDRKVREVCAEVMAQPADCAWMGWQVARHVLNEGGAPRAKLLTGIPHGQDQHGPDEKAVYLEEDVRDGRSVFAVAVAAHEAGQAT